MAEENSKLFRKKVIDRVSTPEELDHYLQVTSPGIWIALIAVVVFLVGVLGWAVFGHIQKTVNVAVVRMDGNYVCLLTAETKRLVNEDSKVVIGERTFDLIPTDLDPIVLGTKGGVDLNVKLSLGLKNGDILYPVMIDGEPDDIPTSTYIGKFLLELVKPISLIIN